MNDSASTFFLQTDLPHLVIASDAAGGSIHDARLWPEVPAATLFEPNHLGRSEGRGRGGVHFLDTPLGPALCRHYRRGGLAARVATDRYLWLGAERSRPFREFRLLAALHAAGLPVPQPLAARYLRSSLFYRADLITLSIRPAATLAELLDAAPAMIDWVGLGATIARFHRAGVWHADLNAHNVLWGGNENHVGNAPGWWLIDFDRGRRRPLAADWPGQNLRRLRRSLVKLGAAAKILDFDQRAWPELLAAHAAALRDA